MQDSRYVSRQIDVAVQERFSSSLTGSASERWIHLDSRTGHGNTSLLGNVRHWLTVHPERARDTAVLYVNGARGNPAQGESDGIPPLIYEVSESLKERNSWRDRVRRWWLRIRWLRFWRNFLFSTTFVCLLVVASVWTEHNDRQERYWKLFLPEVESEHFWRRFLFEVVLVGFGAAFMAEILKKPREEEKSGGREKTDEQINGLKRYGTELVEALDEIRRGKTKFLFLLDNAHLLQKEATIFLHHLVGIPGDASPHSGVSAFAGRCRTCVIEHSNNGARARHALEVPAFSRDELEKICLKQNRVFSTPEVRNELIDIAESEGNIHALLVEENAQLRADVSEEFDRANEWGIFGPRDLMTVYATQYGDLRTSADLRKFCKALDHEAFFEERPDSLDALIEPFLDGKSKLFRIDDGRFYQNVEACKYLREYLRDRTAGSDIEKDKRGRTSLARAHVWWLTSLIDSTFRTHEPFASFRDSAVEGRIQRAAWHAIDLADLDGQKDDAPSLATRIGAFLASTRLTEERKIEYRCRAACALLLTSEINLVAGNTDAVRQDLGHAVAWLSDVPWTNEKTSRDRYWLSYAARVLWQAYWITFDPDVRSALEELLQSHSGLEQDTNSIVFKQYEDLLKGTFQNKERCPAPPESDNDLTNIWNLTSILRQIRETHGFTRKGLEDSDLSIPAAAPAKCAHWAEFTLLQMSANAAILREDWSEADEKLDAIRARLQVVDRSVGPISERLTWTYLWARYHHLLRNCWEARYRAIDEPSEQPPYPRFETDSDVRRLEWERYESGKKRHEQEISGLGLWLQQHSDAKASQGYSIEEAINREANSDYRTAIQFASLLGYTNFLLNAEFWFGELIWDYQLKQAGEKKVVEAEIKDESARKKWDSLFEDCIRIEQDAGWALHTPAIHRIRWRFVERGDRPQTVYDAYNLLQSAQKAGYPDPLVLELHSETRKLITSFASQVGDARLIEAGAGLYQAWAESLCLKPAAIQAWTFSQLVFQRLAKDRQEELLSIGHFYGGQFVISGTAITDFWRDELHRREASPDTWSFRDLLAVEQSGALIFAAQQWRMANNLDKAEALLVSARSELERVFAPSQLKLGRAPEAESSIEPLEFPSPPRSLLLSLNLQLAWTLNSKPSDETLAVKKDRIVEIWKSLTSEDDLIGATLRSLVELERTQGILSQPCDGEAAVPADEDNPELIPAGNSDWKPINLFHFRMRQMRYLGCGTAPGRLFYLGRVAEAESAQRNRPGNIQSESFWRGQNRFGEAVMHLASMELDDNLLGDHRGELIDLLAAVVRVFDRIKELDKAISGFRLLMALDSPNRDTYLSEYITASSEHSGFIGRAFRFTLAQSGLLAAARFAQEQFGPVVDPATVNRLVQTRLTDSGQTLDGYTAALQALRKALDPAREAIRREAFHAALESLALALPEPFCSSRSWVHIDHLEALDLCVGCANKLAARGSLSGRDREFLRSCESRLRQMTVDFIYQFANTVRAQEMKELANTLGAIAGTSRNGTHLA